MRGRRLTALATLAVMLTAGCGKSPTSPTSATASASNELFTGTLSPGGSAFYSFALNAAGTVAVTLASVTTGAGGQVMSGLLGVALGTPSGFGCASIEGVDAAPGLVAQLTAARDPGIYCVKLSDSGSLASDGLFVVRVVTSAAVSSSTSTTTDTFASQLARGGSATRAFTTQAAGVVRVTLTAFADGTTPVGLGFGVPATSACNLTQSVVVVPGGEPQIALNADAGSYCVRLSDTGVLRDDAGFSMTIEHP